ncbi:hypothetical protein NPL1_02645 [Metamycoplasma hyosynoviae]|nr:hypothetical protein NPL1_02645 [Metamycoplasma hyosynoviae]
MLEEHNDCFVLVPTKMNFSYKVSTSLIQEEILKICKQETKTQITSIKILLDKLKHNININLEYKINDFKEFTFQTKKVIFVINQKVLSLINTKPNNINMIFKGCNEQAK